MGSENFWDREYYRHTSRLHQYRSWYVYTAASQLDEPFTLGELQDAVEEMVHIRPQARRLLSEMHEFYEKHDIAIISRTEPGADSFVLNTHIDLAKEAYRSIIQEPRTSRGRPRKCMTEDDNVSA